MNSSFKLLSKTEMTICYYNRMLVNYPKNEVVLKSNIEKNMYELVECLFYYNFNDTDRIKQKYLKDYLVKLAMLDFYTNVSYNKKIIGKKQYGSVGNFIIEMRKMVYGILKNEKFKADKVS